MLIDAARAGRALTYGQVLAYFGRRVGRGSVAALCRDLGVVSARNRSRGEPELAVLVVRRADGLPGEGFFRAMREEGRYDGPSIGPKALAFVAAEQAKAFARFRP